jgi:cobalt/nickel transport system permease protein
VGIVLTPPHAWPAYPLLWALLAGLAAAGRLNLWRLTRAGAWALPFTLAAATLLFTTPGQPVVHFLGLTISDAGLARFVAILLKSWLAVQAALLLSMTTPLTDLLWALTSLHAPGTLVAIFSFMYRYLFTLQDESERLNRARAARSASGAGRKSGGSLRWRAQVTGGLVGSLLLRSFERGERVYAAMLARGYTGQMRMINPPSLTWRAVGWGAMPVLALVIIEGLALLFWSG